LRSVEPPQASVASNPVHIHWGPVGLSPGLNELQIPGFTVPMRLSRSGRLIRLVVPRDPSASPTSPAKWWCKWWCIYRASSPRNQCWPPFSKVVQRTPSPLTEVLRVFLGSLDGIRCAHAACIAELLSDLGVPRHSWKKPGQKIVTMEKVVYVHHGSNRRSSLRAATAVLALPGFRQRWLAA
jgi:hypothetical protein